VAEQDGLLKKVPRILIGTPNRLLSLYDEKMIDFSRLQTVIVDEVDKILIPLSRYATVKERYNRQVHIPPGEKLLDILSNQRKKPKVKRMGIGGGMQDAAKNQKLQWIVCSATLNSPMKALLKKKGWMTTPAILDMNTTLPSTIKHSAYYLNEQELLVHLSNDDLESVNTRDPLPLDQDVGFGNLDLIAECISSLCYQYQVKNGMLFVETSESLLPLIEKLNQIGLKAEYLSKYYDYTLVSKAGQSQTLKVEANPIPNLIIARESEARGLDIPNLDHVFIIGDLSPQSYIHTSGRTGRFENTGRATVLLTNGRQKDRHLQMLKQLKIQIN
jgi:superfamily II DNA/RNA helicase